MTKHATGTFDTKDWEETTVSEIDGGGKLTHVSCIKTFHGKLMARRRRSTSCSTVPTVQVAMLAWNT